MNKESKQLTACAIGTASYITGIATLLAGVSWGGLFFLLLLPAGGYVILSDLRSVA